MGNEIANKLNIIYAKDYHVQRSIAFSQTII